MTDILDPHPASAEPRPTATPPISACATDEAVRRPTAVVDGRPPPERPAWLGGRWPRIVALVALIGV